jgi:predicted Zn-dependent protease
MRKTVTDMVASCEAELHENVVVPKDQAERERDHLIEKHIDETANQRNERLAYEEEFLKDNPVAAEKYLLELMKSEEGESTKMYAIAQFYLRQQKLDKAEIYLKDAFAFDIANKEVGMAYACLLCQM